MANEAFRNSGPISNPNSRENSSRENNIVVFPGSFDPITNGHVDLVDRLAQIFDKVIVLISDSSEKTSFFSIAEKKNLIRESCGTRQNVIVDSWQGLTVDYVRAQGSRVIARGLRTVADFEYEMAMSGLNKNLAPDIETLLMFSKPEHSFISSRWVKEIAKNGGSLTNFVPTPVAKAIEEKYKQKK